MKHAISFTIKHYDELPSTNTLARQHAIDGDAEGLVIVTEHQTHGHGQQGRRWESPPKKNLLFSLLLRPKVAPNKAPALTQMACHSIAKVLRENYQIDSSFKRPNDIMVNQKKLCGVLVEAISTSKTHVDSAVIGVGLNVNSEPGDLLETAISMREITGKEFNRSEILDQILNQFQADIREFI